MTSTDFDTATAALDDIAGDYTLDPAHSRLGFVARHAMVTKVRGEFTEFTGTAHIDTADPSRSSVTLTIDAVSVSTGSKDRDGHLVSPRLLRRREYPEHHLRLDRRSSRDGDEWTDHRRPDHQGRHQAGRDRLRAHRLGAGPVRQRPDRLRGRGHRSRKDWGLTWNAALETGGVLVSDKVRLEFDISAIKNA